MKHKYNNPKTITVIFIFVVTILLSGCVSSAMKKKGMAYFNTGDFDKAVEYFQKEVARKPDSSVLRAFLFRAKLRSYYNHVSLARKNREANRKEEAIKEYKIALAIFPLNKKLEDEYNAFAEVKKVPRDEFKSTIIPPVTLSVDPKEKISIKLPAAPIKKIFSILGKSFNVNIIFDKDFRDFVYGLEIENVGFYQILNQLCMVCNSRYRVLDSGSILVYPDTTFKRRTFDLQGVKVFYLSNVKVEEAKKLLMTIFRDQRIQAQEDTNLNSIIIKAGCDTLIEIERFLYDIDKEKSEVEVDIQIMEVNRNIMNVLGTDLGVPLLSVSAGTVSADGAVSSTFNVNDIKNTNFFMTIPSAALNFLASDDNTRIISKPNLRGISGEEMSFKVGEERPVPQTSFQSIAAGGVSTVPMTTYTYKQVGVDIKITPHVHHNNEVTLELKLVLKSVIGYIDAFPILGNRELENVIRLKEGETNIVGGFIEDEVRGTVTGLPFLSKIPLLGKLFSRNTKDRKQKDLIFSITPRVIRKLDVGGGKQATIWTNVHTVPGGGSVDPGRGPDDRKTGRQAAANRITISPGNRKAAVNSSARFTLRVNSSVDIASLNVSGSVDGPKAIIEEVKTDFLKGSVKVFKNFSGNSFDIGLSNLDKRSRSSIIGQVKVKFLEKGNYVLKIDNTTAMTRDGKAVEYEALPAKIEVNGGTRGPQPRRRDEGERKDGDNRKIKEKE